MKPLTTPTKFLSPITHTSPTKFFILTSLIIILVLLLGLALYNSYYYLVHQTVLSSLENPTTLNLKDFEKQQILVEINQLYSLGDDQNAVVGKIVNVDRLASRNAFFKKARNGNYLLVMPQFTLIYDKENKTIVDIAKENLLDLSDLSNPK